MTGDAPAVAPWRRHRRAQWLMHGIDVIEHALVKAFGTLLAIDLALLRQNLVDLQACGIGRRLRVVGQPERATSAGIT